MSDSHAQATAARRPTVDMVTQQMLLLYDGVEFGIERLGKIGNQMMGVNLG